MVDIEGSAVFLCSAKCFDEIVEATIYSHETKESKKQVHVFVHCALWNVETISTRKNSEISVIIIVLIQQK